MDINPESYTLYPDIESYTNGFIDLDGHHQMYWEISGNPDGLPVVFLHGGPGAGASPLHRRFFDPNYYKIIIFDQRGSGRSIPFADITANTTQHLVSDMESLRQYLKIDKWLVFGGSWGSSLALCYGIEYPDRVLGFILRGLFLCSRHELDWFLDGIKTVFPKEWEDFRNFLPNNEREEILNSYFERLINTDADIHGPAACAWTNFEAACSTLLPHVYRKLEPNSGQRFLALARIEAHYFKNRFFLSDNYFYKNLDKIIRIPATVVQGRYDMVCPMVTAYDLVERWPKAKLIVIPDAGHSAMDPSLKSGLIATTEYFKENL